ncbi:hypothetical protein [Evansella halocellulosilytica]|uniref:hypothetical protein n=1 Tax=Evansella halocellulosilytica TaxID=2011013 RepID=UPI0015CC3BDE|nr:hypothetical protein [Evansella halocellulosilytica]
MKQLSSNTNLDPNKGEMVIFSIDKNTSSSKASGLNLIADDMIVHSFEESENIKPEWCR